MPDAFVSLDHVRQVSGDEFKNGCAVLDGGEVWCWGDNSKGQLGRGTIAPNFPSRDVGPWFGPAPVVGIRTAVEAAVP